MRISDWSSDVCFSDLYRQVMVSGEDLTDAQQGYDQTGNQPIVNIRFNGAGGRKFGQVTSQNVNRPFAIILDGQVLSAPNINEPILGGSAQIRDRKSTRLNSSH